MENCALLLQNQPIFETEHFKEVQTISVRTLESRVSNPNFVASEQFPIFMDRLPNKQE